MVNDDASYYTTKAIANGPPGLHDPPAQVCQR